jgi:hypothetical protein
MAAMARDTVLLILVVLVGGVLVQPSFAMPPVAAGRVLHSHAAEIDFILRSGSTENLIATIGVDGAGNIEATFPGAPIPLVGNVSVGFALGDRVRQVDRSWFRQRASDCSRYRLIVVKQ